LSRGVIRNLHNNLLSCISEPSIHGTATGEFGRVSKLSERFFKTVGRHFVTLSCVQRPSGKGEEKILVFSGFLVETGGVWFYVTAGHILRDIQASLKAGGEFDVWRLDDQTAGNRFRAAIPYAFDIGRWLVIEKEEIGLDYSAIALDTIYRLQLQAGGAIPIGKVAWGNHLDHHDHWVLVGVPSETIAYDQETIITGRTVMIPLEHTEEPAPAGRKAENQFYARLKDVGDVKDIDGVSGGPVFAFKKIDGEWKYRVIGVQSSWYPSSRTIAACPFSSLGAALEELVASAKASIGQCADPKRVET
jgi:hypothetical protein